MEVARKVAACDSALSFLLFRQKIEVKPDSPEEQPLSEAVDTPKSSKVYIYIAVDYSPLKLWMDSTLIGEVSEVINTTYNK